MRLVWILWIFYVALPVQAEVFMTEVAGKITALNGAPNQLVRNNSVPSGVSIHRLTAGEWHRPVLT